MEIARPIQGTLFRDLKMTGRIQLPPPPIRLYQVQDAFPFITPWPSMFPARIFACVPQHLRFFTSVSLIKRKI